MSMLQKSRTGVALSIVFLALAAIASDSTDETSPQPALQIPHSDEDFQQHADDLALRLDGRAFIVCVEKPFVLVSDLPDHELNRWKQTVRWAVSRLTDRYFDRPPREIIDVWLFRNSDSYQRHVEEFFGEKPSTKYGYYSPRHRALVMDISTGGGTLVHEIVHPFMEANFARCPAWFNEGLASLYEQSQEKEGEIQGLTNWRLAGLQSAIRKQKTVSFRELCHSETSQFYGDRSGLLYAQARYLCLYLQEKGLLKRYYHDFRNSAGSDPSGYKTLIRTLGTKDMSRFQNEWHQYVLGLSFSSRD